LIGGREGGGSIGEDVLLNTAIPIYCLVFECQQILIRSLLHSSLLVVAAALREPVVFVCTYVHTT
jgi:hypothetical protein